MGYLQILSAAVLWGLIGPVSSVALREGVSAQEVALWRAVIAGVAFAVHGVAAGGGVAGWRVARRDWAGVAAFGLVGIAGLYTAYFTAVRLGGSALAAVLLYTAPAWVAVLSALFLHERLSRRAVLALLVTFAGVTLVAGAGGELRAGALAVAAGLASGVAYATYYLFGGPFFRRYSAATLFTWALPIGALALLPLVEFAPKSGAAWASLAFVALVSTYAPYLLYAASLRHLTPTRAATMATVEPVVAAVAAWVAFGERLTPLAIAGAALVMAGVLVMVRAGR